MKCQSFQNDLTAGLIPNDNFLLHQCMGRQSCVHNKRATISVESINEIRGKAVFRAIFTSLIITTSLSGCLREPPKIYLPVGHPADPETRPGKAIKITRALEAEILDAEPMLGKQKVQNAEKRSNDHGGHQMHKH